MSNAPAPRVHMEQSQQEEGMTEDIGLLQNTIVRAEFSKLPSIFSKPFYSYMWQLIKSKGVALYGYVPRFGQEVILKDEGVKSSKKMASSIFL
jgi:nucleoside recognition membrane protein YjiH